jgi:hypothetical protein
LKLEKKEREKNKFIFFDFLSSQTESGREGEETIKCDGKWTLHNLPLLQTAKQQSTGLDFHCF